MTQSDREIVLAAVRQDSCSLEYAGKSWKRTQDRACGGASERGKYGGTKSVSPFRSRDGRATTRKVIGPDSESAPDLAGDRARALWTLYGTVFGFRLPGPLGETVVPNKSQQAPMGRRSFGLAVQLQHQSTVSEEPLRQHSRSSNFSTSPETLHRRDGDRMASKKGTVKTPLAAARHGFHIWACRMDKKLQNTQQGG